MEPVLGRFEFAIIDGHIAETTHRYRHMGEAWLQFVPWVGDNHPDQRDTVLRTFNGAVSGQPVLSPESFALWDQYLDEFAESYSR